MPFAVRVLQTPKLYARPYVRTFTRLHLPRTGQTNQTRRMAATARSIDHLVLTVVDIPTTVKWYQKLLSMSHMTFKSIQSSTPTVERHALLFGDQKINLHQLGKEFEPKAHVIHAGSADLCFLVEENVDEVLPRLKGMGVKVLEGGKVVERTGARGRLRSVYVRDPDGNLIELSNMV